MFCVFPQGKRGKDADQECLKLEAILRPPAPELPDRVGNQQIANPMMGAVNPGLNPMMAMMMPMMAMMGQAMNAMGGLGGQMMSPMANGYGPMRGQQRIAQRRANPMFASGPTTNSLPVVNTRDLDLHIAAQAEDDEL